MSITFSRIKVVLLLALVNLAGCNDEQLFSALPEQQVNEVEAVLLAAGIKASKKPGEEEGAWSVSVPADQFPHAVALLEARGLPRVAPPTLHDVFPKEGFVSSPLEERARYIYALSQELANTLMQIDGVVSARVHVALPEKAMLEEEQRSASVSVVIIQEPDIDLSKHEIDIKAIVTDGVEGLDDVNRVTVRFFNKRRMELPELPVAPQREAAATAALYAGVGGFAIGGVIVLAVSLFRRRQRR